jgi:DNA-binding MarR family transcriptional regulator
MVEKHSFKKSPTIQSLSKNRSFLLGVFEIHAYVEQLNNFSEKQKQRPRPIHNQMKREKRGSGVVKQDPCCDAGLEKTYVLRQMDDFSFLQRNILKFFYKISDPKTRLTAKLTSDDIAKALNRTPTAFKSTVARLIKNGWLERAERKNAVQGWTRYRLSEKAAAIVASKS